MLAKHRSFTMCQPLFMQNFHSASRQQDTNFIWLVASRMQTGYFVLHGRKLDAICIWLAAD
jgi:hypothetical protein